jgi:hypothetical protein
MTDGNAPVARGYPETTEPLTLVTCNGVTTCNKGSCDFSGWVEFVEPTTNRVTGGSQVCKTCGMLAMDHSLRYGT